MFLLHYICIVDQSIHNTNRSGSTKKLIMKSKLIKTSILFLVIFLGLSSCKKDEKASDDKNNSGDFYFKVKMDGKDYPSDIGDGKTAGMSHSGTLLTIKDKAGNNPGFFINIHNYAGAKTYQIGASTSTTSVSNASYSEILTANKWYFWGSTAEAPGTITISSDKNNVIEGTFSFNGYNPDDKTTRRFTEGKFRLKVQP